MMCARDIARGLLAGHGMTSQMTRHPNLGFMLQQPLAVSPPPLSPRLHICHHLKMTDSIARAAVHMPPLRSFLNKCKPPFQSPVHLVIGNEAADMDSIVCAIAYAYLRKASSPFPTVPVVNIPRSELPLRRDVLGALMLAELYPADLLFIDEVPGGLASSEALTLVDHNALARHQKDATPRVIGIIDHHADEGLHASAAPRIIEKVGSCSTLVAELIDGTEDLDLHDVGRLLSCAIMLDTANLKDAVKTTARDEDALRKLGELRGGWTVKTRDSVYQRLKKSRQDLEGMNAHDVLRRDLKIVQGGNLDVAFASVGMRPAALVEAAGKEGFAGCMKRFAKERGVSCVAVLATYGGKGAGTQRYLVIMKGEVGDALQRVLRGEDDHGMGVDPAEIEGGEGVWWFKLRDGSMSRKIVSPKLVLALAAAAEHLNRPV